MHLILKSRSCLAEIQWHLSPKSCCSTEVCLCKGFPPPFVSSYFSITCPMNDSGATVFVANSHSFFIAALSWKPSPFLNHPAGSRLDFHHWWMKCHTGIFFFFFLPRPTQMHEFINCGCGTDGLPCSFWWHFHTWLTVENVILVQEHHTTASLGEFDTVKSFQKAQKRKKKKNIFINPDCFAYLLQQAHMVYFAPTTQQMLFSGKTNACTSLIDCAWLYALRCLSQPHFKPLPVQLLWISSYLLNDQNIKWYKCLI